MSMKFPVRIEDERFIVDAEHELVAEVNSATEEELQFIVEAMNKAGDCNYEQGGE